MNLSIKEQLEKLRPEIDKLVMKAKALPDGHISHRKDGDYKKISGQWIKVPNTGRDADPEEKDSGGVNDNAPGGTARAEAEAREMSFFEKKKDWEEKGTKGVAFKSWFGDWETDPENSSKIRKDGGKGAPEEMAPIKMYHGTPVKGIEEFDIKKFGKTDEGWFGKGFYFSDSPSNVQGYAGDTKEALEGDIKIRKDNIVKMQKEIESIKSGDMKLESKEYDIIKYAQYSDDPKIKDLYKKWGDAKNELTYTPFDEREKRVAAVKKIRRSFEAMQEKAENDPEFWKDISESYVRGNEAKIKEAEGTIKSLEKQIESGRYGEVKEVFLNVRKPFELWEADPGTPQWEENQRVIRSLNNKELNDAIESEVNDIFKDFGAARTTRLLKKKGYDGFILKRGGGPDWNDYENFSYQEVCVFDPENIKSTKNNGQFYKYDANIFRSADSGPLSSGPGVGEPLIPRKMKKVITALDLVSKSLYALEREYGNSIVMKAALPVGTKREWKSGTHEKQQDGSWKPVKGEKGSGKEDEPKSDSAGDRSEEEKIKEWKNEGVKSKVFKDWFGDWENDPEGASKIRKDSGTGAPEEVAPITMYHGTKMGGFEEFDPDKFGQTDAGWFGKGFYFTDDRSDAEYYGGSETREKIQKKINQLQNNADAINNVIDSVNSDDLENFDYRALNEEYGYNAEKVMAQLLGYAAHSYSIDYMNNKVKEKADHIKKVSEQVRDGMLNMYHEMIDHEQEKLMTGEYGDIKEVYLNARNPFYLWDAPNGTALFKKNREMVKSLNDQELSDISDQSVNNVFRTYGAEKTTKLLKSLGYDAFILRKPEKSDALDDLNEAEFEIQSSKRRIKKNRDAMEQYQKMLDEETDKGNATYLQNQIDNLSKWVVKFENRLSEYTEKFENLNSKIGDIKYSYKEVCVFDPGQIKATDNKGTFDKSSRNIYKSKKINAITKALEYTSKILSAMERE